MIISYRHKFIFIRTRKTAGTSIESALLPLMGPDDILTGSEIDKVPSLNLPKQLRGHPGYDRIKSFVGPDIKSFYIWCVERNSYEKALSDWWFHRYIRKTTKRNLRDHVLNSCPSDYPMYVHAGQTVANVVQYDNLYEGFNEVLSCLGLSSVDLSKYKYKVSSRPEPQYMYYDRSSLKAIESVFWREIVAFHYKYRARGKKYD